MFTYHQSHYTVRVNATNVTAELTVGPLLTEQLFDGVQNREVRVPGEYRHLVRKTTDLSLNQCTTSYKRPWRGGKIHALRLCIRHIAKNWMKTVNTALERTYYDGDALVILRRFTHSIPCPCRSPAMPCC